MHKARLIAFGDSYTYGDELVNPTVSAWPRLVANRFNYELINLAKPGFSNDAILEKVLEQDITNNDLVIVCFSHYTRLYFEDQFGWFTTISQIKQDQSFREDISKLLITVLSDKWLFKRWLKQIIYLQAYLKAKNVKFLFTVANLNEVNLEMYYTSNENLVSQIDNKTFLGKSNETFETLTWYLPRGTFRHPLEDAHATFASFIIENLVKIYNL